LMITSILQIRDLNSRPSSKLDGLELVCLYY
jgi:hypothetical protein